jgi:hypothetical protein
MTSNDIKPRKGGMLFKSLAHVPMVRREGIPRIAFGDPLRGIRRPMGFFVLFKSLAHANHGLALNKTKTRSKCCGSDLMPLAGPSVKKQPCGLF